MLDVKPWYLSKTIWGGIVAVLATVAGLIGFEVDGPARAELVESILLIAGAGGAILAVFGRIVATEMIE